MFARGKEVACAFMRVFVCASCVLWLERSAWHVRCVFYMFSGGFHEDWHKARPLVVTYVRPGGPADRWDHDSLHFCVCVCESCYGDGSKNANFRLSQFLFACVCVCMCADVMSLWVGVYLYVALFLCYFGVTWCMTVKTWYCGRLSFNCLICFHFISLKKFWEKNLRLSWY